MLLGERLGRVDVPGGDGDHLVLGLVQCRQGVDKVVADLARRYDAPPQGTVRRDWSHYPLSEFGNASEFTICSAELH